MHATYSAFGGSKKISKGLIKWKKNIICPLYEMHKDWSVGALNVNMPNRVILKVNFKRNVYVV